QAAYLGAGLASAVNLFNPEKVILGGGFVDVYPPFLKLVKEEIKKRAFPAALLKLQVVKAKLGNEAGLVGAAFLGSR
ncbi:MAG TPA: ROK family protein, partial [candidate division Zixibacteria bacterium]|nr:ROK family protein [candidate division Zixibacteria bacterium]